MRRQDMMKLYTTEYCTDPKTGKEKPTLRYIGPMYTMEKKPRRSGAWSSLLGLVLGVAAFAVAGLTPCWAQLCAYVAPWFVLCLLPLYYLLLGTVKLLRLKAQFTKIDQEHSLGYVRRSGLGMLVLGICWAVATGVFLLVEKPEMTMDSEILFLCCGGVMALAGLLPFSVKAAVTEVTETHEVSVDQ